MKLFASTLLCIGLAACSHDKPAESAYDSTQTTADASSTTRDPSMTPASAENAPSRTAAASDANRRESGALQPTMNTADAGPSAPNRSGTDTSAANRDARDANAAPSTIGSGTSATGTTTSGSSTHATDTTSADKADHKADNTKINERDRNGQNPTPMSQGNNETDLRITQQIRKAVMGDKSLSFTAKNVKIITSGGHVVLRGTVKSDAERASIERAAHEVAGVGQVDNQIDVKQ